VPGLKFLLRATGGNAGGGGVGGGVEVPVTFKVALAGEVFVITPPAPMDVNASEGSVLIRLPGMVAVTSTATVHDPGVIPD
jgi:hypothetical protein